MKEPLALKIVACLLNLLLSSDLVSTSIHPKHKVGGPNNNTEICGKRLFTENSGHFASPGFPVRYPLNIICTYEITVEYDFRIELHWKDFDVDGFMPHCEDKESDYVNVYFGCKAERRYLTRFCSANAGIPHSIYTTDNCLTIELVTKPNPLSKVNRGFLAYYNAVNFTEPLKKQHCNSTFTKDHGILHSSFWPITYHDLAIDSCQWRIKVDQDKVIKFSVMDMFTENPYGNTCNMYEYYWTDALSIKGIGSNYASVTNLRKFYGHCLPFTYNSLYSELIVNWKMGFSSPYYSHDDRGFIVGYVAYTPVSGRKPAIWQICLLTFAIVVSSLVFFLITCQRRCKLVKAERRNGERGEYRRLPTNDIDSESNDDRSDDLERPINNELANEHDIIGDGERNAGDGHDRRLSFEGYLHSNNGSMRSLDQDAFVHFASQDQIRHSDTFQRDDDISLSSDIAGDQHSVQNLTRNQASEPYTSFVQSNEDCSILPVHTIAPSVKYYRPPGEDESEVHDLISYQSDIEPSAPEEQQIPSSPAPDYDEIFQGLQTLMAISADGVLKTDRLD